jgi:hypothetical protein
MRRIARSLLRSPTVHTDSTTLRLVGRQLLRHPPRSARHLRWTLGMAALHVGLGATLRAAFSADDLLFPGWRKVEVKEPVFVLAAARSGTTFLHRLLALDEERFFTPSLYQTVLPSVSVARAATRIADFDARLGAPSARLLAKLEGYLFGGWSHIHPMGLGAPEEDEAIFVHTLVSPALYLLMPDFERLSRLSSPEELSPEDRDALMRFYRDCLRRLLSTAPGERTLLVKNVLSAGRVDALLETFPDLRVVSPLRHPYEAIPSLVSMFDSVWKAVLPKGAAVDHRAFARIAMDYYRRSFELEQRLPADHFMRLRYDALVREPEASVREIYERFGWHVSSAFAARLRAECERARDYKSEHHYRLEDYGLDREMIRSGLAPVFEQCEFDS